MNIGEVIQPPKKYLVNTHLTVDDWNAIFALPWVPWEREFLAVFWEGQNRPISKSVLNEMVPGGLGRSSLRRFTLVFLWNTTLSFPRQEGFHFGIRQQGKPKFDEVHYCLVKSGFDV